MISESYIKDIITFFFSLRNNLYYYHLTTYSYPRHVAVGNLVDTFDGLIDKFLEILFGKYGRPDSISEIDIKIVKQSDGTAYLGLTEYIEELNNFSNILSPNDTDLLNIRDEMTGLLNNNKYLFLLH